MHPRFLASALILVFSACATAGAGKGAPRSGGRFENREPFPEQPPNEVLRWQLDRHRGVWHWEDVPPGPPPPRRVSGRELRVTMINHATLLIQMDSLNILTDPVWSERIGAAEWLGQKRYRPPGIRFEDLPPIDVVLLSHDHYDHLDIPTLQRLQRAFHPRIVAGLGVPALLRQYAITTSVQLDWWQSVRLPNGDRVMAVPAQHWSGRTLWDHRRTLWAGFVVEGKRDTVYFAGDTGPGSFLEEIQAHYHRFRAALLPIAPFIPRWYMGRKHMAPDDAVRAAQVVRASTAIAIHWGTFELGDDGQHEAVDTLRAVLAALPAGCRPSFVVLTNGEALDVPPLDPAGLNRRASDDCAPHRGAPVARTIDTTGAETTIRAYYAALAARRPADARTMLAQQTRAGTTDSALAAAASQLRAVRVGALRPVVLTPDRLVYEATLDVDPDPANPGEWAPGPNVRWIEVVPSIEGWKIGEISSSPLT